MFQNPFSFEGRIRRTEYGLSFIIYAVIAGIINIIIAAGQGDDNAFMMIAYFPMLWFLWAQGAKRCHDLGNNGWWQLIPFYTLWLIFQDGQPGLNQYGENPKGIQFTGVQTYQTGSNNPIQRNPNSQVKMGSGYQGSYSGGHNNPSSNYNQTGQKSNSEGYQNGDLYN